MFIQPFPSGPYGTNTIVIGCPNTKKAVIIDPAPGSTPVVSSYLFHNQLEPIAILLTHSHWDHIADAAEVKRKFNIPLYVHALDAENVIRPGADFLPSPIEIEATTVEHLLKEGDVFTVGDIQIEVIETPGHTPGGICFYIKDKNVLISGDTLFKGAIGNLSFPTSRPDLMKASLTKLCNLPAITKVYPGHGPTTTIGNESSLCSDLEIFE